MEQLVRLREIKGFSQRALANESGVSPATVYELENGRRKPNPSTLRKLASALDVEVADLLGEEYPKEARRSSLEPTLFNGLEEERRSAFIERCRRYIEARVSHYERRLAEAERGGFFAGYQGAKALRDDAFDELMQLSDLLNGEMAERWLGNPEVPHNVKEALGFALADEMQKLASAVGRIGQREAELAETVEQKAAAEQNQAEIRRWTREIA